MFCMPLLQNDKELLGNSFTGLHFSETPDLRAQLPGNSSYLGTNSLASFWFKRDPNSSGGQIIGSSQAAGLVNGEYQTSGMWSIASGDLFDRGDGIAIGGYWEGGSGQGNSSYTHFWSNSNITSQTIFDWTNWNHFFFYYDNHRSSYPGDISVTLYVNGTKISKKSATGPGVYFNQSRLKSPLNIGYNINCYEGTGIGNTLNTPFLYSGKPTGCVGQVWIGDYTLVYDSYGNQLSVPVNDYYSNGFVDLGGDGTQGKTKTLNMPRFYNKCDYPFTGITPLVNGNVVAVSQSFNCYNY